MIRDNTDCPYLHDIFDQYCNLFKGYKNCDKCDCEVLKTLKENEQLKQELLIYKDAICNRECAEVWEESERLKKENEQLKQQKKTMKECYFNSCLGCENKNCEVKK